MKTTNTRLYPENPIDPLFKKPHDNISGIINFDPNKIKRLTSSAETKRKPGRISRKAASAALVFTVAAGLFVANDQINKADQKAAASFEQDTLQNAPKTVLAGELVLNTGVRLRSTPAISNPTEESEGNIEFVIQENQIMIAENPVA